MHYRLTNVWGCGGHWAWIVLCHVGAPGSTAYRPAAWQQYARLLAVHPDPGALCSPCCICEFMVCVRHLGMQCEPLFQTDSAHEPTSVVVWRQLHVGYALWECAGKPLKEKGPYLPTLLHSKTLAVWLQPWRLVSRWPAMAASPDAANP